MLRILSNYISKEKLKNKRLNQYMFSYLTICTGVSSILLILEGSRESLSKKNELWKTIKDENLEIYKKLRMSSIGILANTKSKTGQKIAISVYKFFKKIVGFN